MYVWLEGRVPAGNTVSSWLCRILLSVHLVLLSRRICIFFCSFNEAIPPKIVVLKYEFVSIVLIDFGCPCNDSWIQLMNDLQIVSDVPSLLYLQLISVLQILQKSD